LTTNACKKIPKAVLPQVLNNHSVFDPPESNPVQKFTRSLIPNGKRVKDQTFGFDRVFDDNVTQAEVYEGTTKNLLGSVLDGYNATVFAYGATGCGKTHTITGTVQQPGIIFLTMQELFERIGERSEDKVSEISLSYLEIYNETIRDLLAPPTGNKQGLMLREDANQAVSVAGLSSHRPKDVHEVMDMLVRGNENRTMSPTEANATSSRSHAVIQINVSERDRNSGPNEPHTMATLSIIDLAGSERASATKNRGERLLEGANINKSLLALGGCINALCDPRKKNHIPYRNSKLTRLLKFSLGGNCKTVMIVCVSPSSAHFDETQNTLRYANRAKNIQTKVTRNVYNVNRHVKDFLVKIDEQMAMINELKAQQKDYESVAFAKFRKQGEKRESVVREGVARIRNAYDHASSERLEKLNNMKKLRQLERRITILDTWTSSFDEIVAMQEDESILSVLAAVRKQADGIITELEETRKHLRSQISKSNWERAIDSALQNALHQLAETDPQADADVSDNLRREAEILKSSAEREALTAIAEQERLSEAGTVQVLLKAHFDTIAAVQNLLSMDEESAISAATGILRKIVQGTSEVTSHLVKPNGTIVLEPFAPSKAGTPKRKKQANFLKGTPLGGSKVAVLAATSHVSSPLRGSPKRRKFGAAKKGVQFTPKRSPVKNTKRGVRWRDDTEDGTLAEFEKTPQKVETTPEVSSTEQMPPPPPLPDSFEVTSSKNDFDTGSSPIPPAPEFSMTTEGKPRSNRFKSGFLSKRAQGSPLGSGLHTSSSDSDHSPLRDINLSSSAANRSSLNKVLAVSQDAPNDSGNTSSSDVENKWMPEKDEAAKVKMAVKRASLNTGSATAQRSQRRRSPAGASSGSPPSENMFTASHARRMVRSEKENEWKHGVLSPRTAPISKAPTRRTTMSGDSRSNSATGTNREGGGRMSVAATPAIGGSMRGSLSTKGAWR
jgi:kinesin family protein 18/19